MHFLRKTVTTAAWVTFFTTSIPTVYAMDNNEEWLTQAVIMPSAAKNTLEPAWGTSEGYLLPFNLPQEGAEANLAYERTTGFSQSPL